MNALQELITGIHSYSFSEMTLLEQVALLDKAQLEYDALRAELKAALRVEAIARTIFEVVDTGMIFRTAKACPHGNYATPSHNHPWWCDECWLELMDALEASALAKGDE